MKSEELLDAPVVVAIDPGGITGWAVMQVHPEALVNPSTPILANVEHWGHGQIISPANDSAEMACVDELVDLIREWPGCCVVMEDFILRMYSKGRELLSPVRLNSMLTYAVRHQLGIQVTHRQQASDAKTAVTDARLKMWGFYERTGGMEHARDADRHALLWMRKAKDASKGTQRRGYWWPYLYGPGAPYYVPPAGTGATGRHNGHNGLNPGSGAGQGGTRTVQVVNVEEGKDPAKLAAALLPQFRSPGKVHARGRRVRASMRS